MREKLLDLMKREGLKPSQLAEMLEINPAGVSHILAGRNKPGFDLLQKILRRFPRINPDWLLLDSDKMYRDQIPTETTPASRSAIVQPSMPDDLFAQASLRNPNAPASGTPHNVVSASTSPRSEQPGSMTESAPSAAKNLPMPHPESTVARVVIFYTDQTFESFTPTKR